MKPKIFCFVNSGAGTSWQNVSAISEDGIFLAGHISSNEGFAKHDIGIDSDWKHDIYKKYYPDGYELVWVNNPKENGELSKAYELHKSYTEEEYKKKSEILSEGRFPKVEITMEEKSNG